MAATTPFGTEIIVRTARNLRSAADLDYIARLNLLEKDLQSEGAEHDGQ